MGLSMKHARQQNVNHHELQIIKPVDRSSPLLNKAINDNETLECEISLYRTTPTGMQEIYYKIKLFKAHISNIKLIVSHNIIENGNEAQERVSFIYESISWEHCMASTSAYGVNVLSDARHPLIRKNHAQTQQRIKWQLTRVTERMATGK